MLLSRTAAGLTESDGSRLEEEEGKGWMEVRRRMQEEDQANNASFRGSI